MLLIFITFINSYIFYLWHRFILSWRNSWESQFPKQRFELEYCLNEKQSDFSPVSEFWLWLQELKRFPTLRSEIAVAAIEALERFREDGKKTTLRLVEMESSYITVDFFRKLPQEVSDRGGNQASSSADGHFQRIGSNVLSYVGMVSETLRNTIPKAVVHCQVREAKRSLLDHFYAQLSQKEV